MIYCNIIIYSLDAVPHFHALALPIWKVTLQNMLPAWIASDNRTDDYCYHAMYGSNVLLTLDLDRDFSHAGLCEFIGYITFNPVSLTSSGMIRFIPEDAKKSAFG